MNQITAMGRVVKDPDGKAAGSSYKASVMLSVRTGGKKKEGEKYAPSYVAFAEVWGLSGEALVNKIRKGDQVIVTGRAVPTTMQTGEAAMRIENATWEGPYTYGNKTEGETPANPYGDDVPF